MDARPDAFTREARIRRTGLLTLIGTLFAGGGVAHAQPWIVRGYEIRLAVPAGDSVVTVALTLDDTSVPGGDTVVTPYSGTAACGVELVRTAGGVGFTYFVLRFDLELWQLGANHLEWNATLTSGLLFAIGFSF